ncbi:MAG: phosphoribosylamine--glycine ligase [Alphaproteobacteria bacterium]|nr:phosphoribosylamine--glycine ligase [Alphaproteobacteria bacterium]
MNVLVVGSGAREHTLCWSFAKSPLLTKLYCAPGNAGIAELATCLPIAADKVDEIVAACRELKIEFVMPGPEVPLVLGLVDKLNEAGIPCFGPTRAAAMLEGSKGFLKDMCARAGVPTAAYKRFNDAETAKAYVKEQGAPIVIKADGLAAGKGVTVAQTVEEALKAIDDAMIKKVFGDSGNEVVIEECLVGEEASFFALCDGTTAVPFAAAQDHKAVYDGDKGPNTGGMGAYSPAPIVDGAMQERIMREIVQPSMDEMSKAGTPFTGVLFAGLMINAEGPKLIEYNVRFGDPETQCMLPRLKSDLLALLLAASKGMAAAAPIHWYDRAALCVVMAAEGYPGDYKKGSVIRGLDEAAKVPDSIIFHAGTALNDKGEITANGGRVLGVTAWAPTIAEAQARAYEAVDRIDWPEGFCRRDIGWRAIKRCEAA